MKRASAALRPLAAWMPREDYSDPDAEAFVRESTCPACGTVGGLAFSAEPECVACGAPRP